MMLEHALWYIDKNVAVVILNGKEPLGSIAVHGVHSATDDFHAGSSYWGRHPNANIGLAIGVGLLRDVRVLDVDPRHGGDEELGRLVLRHGPLPFTPQQETGAEGSHYLYCGWPTGRRFKTKLRPGLELLGPGRYFVGAPSRHPLTSRPYRWVVGLDTPIAPAPEWLVELATVRGPRNSAAAIVAGPHGERSIPPVRSSGTAHRADVPTATRTSAYSRAALRYAVDAVARAQPGERNTTLNREAFAVARFVVAGEVDEQLARGALVDAATSAGLSVREAETTVQRAMRARRGSDG